jgi:hypothetical protein
MAFQPVREVIHQVRGEEQRRIVSPGDKTWRV